MPLSPYKNTGPIDCSVDFSLDGLKGRSAIVTGGSSGIGEGYVEALVNAGAFVTIGDVNEKRGAELVEKHSGKVQFCKCDVTSWEDQVEMFKAAVSKSPQHSCDIVLANAGVSGLDDVFKLDDPDAEPVKPDLRIVNINLVGVLYTAKLAIHYFRKQPVNESHDRLLVIQGSLAGYLDQPGSPQYAAAKYGCRGLMKSLRRTVGQQDMRVNFIGPWFIKTPILSDKVIQGLVDKGVKFALLEDACKAVLRLASDKSINGRSLGIVPRDTAPDGYLDIDRDDYADSDPMKAWQDEVMRVSHRVAESATTSAAG